MAKKIYSCTISKCKINTPPTKGDILTIRNRFYEDFHANESSFPVHCFEPKKNKDLHYHSTIFAPYIDWKKVIYKGWHIKLAMLKTPYDIVNWCGYINKHKIDSVDIKITLKRVQQFKKDKAFIKSIPNIMSFYNINQSDSD